MIEMIEVTSSNVKAVGYDFDRKVLVVEFKNGTTYEYDEVDETKHSQMMAADSVGGFLNREIKNKHAYRKVT